MCRWPSILTTVERRLGDRLRDLHRDQELGRLPDAPDELTTAVQPPAQQRLDLGGGLGVKHVDIQERHPRRPGWQARRPTLTPGQLDHASIVSRSSG